MPREVKLVAPDKIGFLEYELPPLGPGEVRVRSQFGAPKHGTELAFVKGYAAGRGRYDRELGAFVKAKGPPGPFRPGGVGNMFVGEVTEAGPDVEGLKVGDRVLGYGGFREVHTIPTGRCWKMPEGLSWKSAVCLDPADFAMAAVRDGNVRIGDAVAVFGMGAIGLMAVQIAKLGGAGQVIAVEPLANRRKAAEACGADLVLDPGACDAGVEIRLATDRRGVDVAIEYSGAVAALQAAIRAVAFGGNVVAGAFPPPYGPGLDLGAEAHINIPNIIFSRACSEPNREHPRWTEKRIYATCWRLIKEGKLTGEPIVTPVVPFERLPEEYLKIATEPGTNVKLGVAF
jgi:threonine dehydrogenase-like Zn-dependent dehydrogenase